jgi:hypothetical protein
MLPREILPPPGLHTPGLSHAGLAIRSLDDGDIYIPQSIRSENAQDAKKKSPRSQWDEGLTVPRGATQLERLTVVNEKAPP